MSEVANGRLRAWMTAAIACAIQPRSAFYVSTPITTGQRFVSWRRGPGARLNPGDDVYRERLNREVIQPNREHIVPTVTTLRDRLGDPVIDPTVLEDVPGWHQFDYHRFWADVIRKFAHTVVLADGWQYSSGCVIELTAAISAGCALLRQDLQPLTGHHACALVESAIADVERDGVLPSEPLHEALAALYDLGDDAVLEITPVPAHQW